MKGGHIWDNNNTVPNRDGNSEHGNKWKMSNCDLHVVMENSHRQSPSSICLVCPEADCNSNGCMENHSQPNSNCHQMTNNEPVSKSYTGKLTPVLHGIDYKWDSQQLSGQCPTSIYSVSLNQKEINYEDLSKNIDANLAEIDMETFRSEDIHSILALPVMYSGDFQSATNGEQCASVSGSLLGGLELDSSISPRSTSEDEISICKDEPLFSPVKEHPLPDGTISVDSLDCSSLEEHDLVLTCRANKSNYTIAFEGSGTQFSDDSDYQDTLGITEIAVSQDTEGKQRNVPNKVHTGPMVQSDFAFTTWSKLKRTKEVAKVRGKNTNNSTTKSQSLPNLLRHSVLSEKLLNQWASGLGSKGCVPVYDLQSSQSAHSRDSSTDSQQSVSLLKLFIRQRMTNSPECGSTSISSSHSESSATNIINGFQDKTESLTDSYGQLEPISNTSDEISQEADKPELPYENFNQTALTSPIHSTSENTENTAVLATTETNNNTINPLPTDNYNVLHPTIRDHVLVAEGYADSEEENSQYFEDSLMDVPPPASKDFFTSPIKEEEEPLETDTSSGDETMKDSKDPFGSDTGSSQESNITRNNKLDSLAQKQEWMNGVERINNVFPNVKSNMILANNACSFNKEEKIPMKRLDFGYQNHSQGTQTKQLNSKECSPIEGINSRLATAVDVNHAEGKVDVLNNVRYSPSRDSSPSSSGYLSSRQGSVERLRQSSQGFINNTNIPNMMLPSRKVNVIITKPCHRSTQIPVHIRDQGIQTSLLDENGMAVSFSIKESNDDNVMESSYLLKLPMKNKDGSKKGFASNEGSGCSEKRSIYVCYPNYSLPDLSFLRSFATSPEAPEVVYLTPTKHKVPSYTKHPRSTQERKRPKSCSDFDSLSCQPFNHIKDWESLSVLLPEDLKSVISKLHDRANIRPLDDTLNIGGKTESNLEGKHSRTGSPICSCTENITHQNKMKLDSAVGDKSAPSSPLLSCKNDDRKPVRGILRKSTSTSDDKDYGLPPRCSSMSTVLPKTQDTKFKRYSLQEPCQRVLENIQEVNSLMNYLNKQTYIKKEDMSSAEKNDELNQRMKAQPCNSALGANFKKGLVSGAKMDYTHHKVSRTLSDENHKRVSSPHRTSSNGNSINNSPIRQLNTPPSLLDETKDKNHPSSYSLLSEIPSVEQLQNQLEHILGSGSNLSLVAAALLAAQDNNSGESNQCCAEGNSVMTNCACLKGKKSVKFGEISAEQNVTLNASPCRRIKTSNENIEHAILKGKLDCGKINQMSPEDDSNDMDFPPQEFAVSPSQCSPASTPSSSPPAVPVSEDKTLSITLLHEELSKRTGLVENLQKAVDLLVAHFSSDDPKKQSELGSSALSPTLGPKIITNFCPAMHALLADGQLPSIPGLLAPLTNSTWRVVEASTKTGNCKRELQELINHINAEEILSSNIQKFNAFLLGVLNLGCLDWWIGHLCSCESIIKCHYHPIAMLSLLTHQAFVHLKEEFQNMVKPLSTLPFSLELSLVSKDFKSKVSQLSTKEQNFQTSSLPASPIKRCYQNFLKLKPKFQESKSNINSNIDKCLKQDGLPDKTPEISMDEFLRMRQDKLPNTAKVPSEENNILSLFPGITVYPFNELKVSSELDFDNKESEESNPTDILNAAEKTVDAEISSLQNEFIEVDGETELMYSSTDSGCSSQIEHTLPNFTMPSQTSDSKTEPEGQMFQKLRQKWEQMTSTPEPNDRATLTKVSSALPASRPPLPLRGRTSDSRRIQGKSPSPAQSRMPRPFSSKRNEIGHHSRRGSPQPSSHKKLPSPASSQTRPISNVSSNSDVNQLDSPENISSSSPSSTLKSKPNLPPPTTRKSLIPVHRVGSRGGTNGSRSRGTTPVGREH
ncbi:uncharacterized protein [Centruroides vittatus]|uniref:uncharacterized protein isoform X1 n=3 Tax=Centruroides vittatus TaxID=120091 RepID=UPI003510815C